MARSLLDSPQARPEAEEMIGSVPRWFFTVAGVREPLQGDREEDGQSDREPAARAGAGGSKAEGREPSEAQHPCACQALLSTGGIISLNRNEVFQSSNRNQEVKENARNVHV